MTVRKIYFGSVGPITYDDADLIDDPDGDFSGEYQGPIKATEPIIASGVSGGVSGSFTTNDGQTVTVTSGIITSIV